VTEAAVSQIAYEIAERTDPGRDPDKQVNEDAVVHADTPMGLLAVVCDGMGGHAGGQEASAEAIRTIVEQVQAAPAGMRAPDALRAAIVEANARVFALETSKKAGFRPGATVVAVLVHEGGAEVAHVGDSRVYLIHAGAIVQVTTDHSMVQKMVEHQLIRPEEAANHPDANKILRALGLAAAVEVDVRAESIPFVSGDTFVLCSDGLSDLVTASDILEIATSQPPAQAAGQLVDLANARGGHDNITVQVLRLRESARVSPDGAPTVVKTVPLTAAQPLPPDASSSAPIADAVPPAEASGATVVAGPVAAPADAPPPAPLAPPTGAPPAQLGSTSVVPAPMHAAPHEGRSGSRLPLIIGLAIAVAGVIAVGLVVYTSQRPSRRAVEVIPEATADASAAAVYDDDNDPSTPPVPVPPLGVAPLASQGVRVVPPATKVRPDAPSPSAQPAVPPLPTAPTALPVPTPPPALPTTPPPAPPTPTLPR
jgi:PPM family protein phosphatase